mmetsp:Transcript_1588/g.3322  ORF Transcript_1588/g.3322 Transcript_1588/m.3322 type:complete len:323 (+) Transcript_1588:396-1364(+)
MASTTAAANRGSRGADNGTPTLFSDQPGGFDCPNDCPLGAPEPCYQKAGSRNTKPGGTTQIRLQGRRRHGTKAKGRRLSTTGWNDGHERNDGQRNGQSIVFHANGHGWANSNHKRNYVDPAPETADDDDGAHDDARNGCQRSCWDAHDAFPALYDDAPGLLSVPAARRSQQPGGGGSKARDGTRYYANKSSHDDATTTNANDAIYATHDDANDAAAATTATNGCCCNQATTTTTHGLCAPAPNGGGSPAATDANTTATTNATTGTAAATTTSTTNSATSTNTKRQQHNGSCVFRAAATGWTTTTTAARSRWRKLCLRCLENV